MKNEFENDPLLQELKRATQVKSAPKIGEEILFRASETKSPSPIRKLQTPRMLVSLTGGAAVLALVAMIATQPKPYHVDHYMPSFDSGAKSLMDPLVTSADAVIFKSEGLSDDVPEAVMYQARNYLPEVEFIKRLADYFEVDSGEISLADMPQKSVRKDSRIFAVQTKPVNTFVFTHSDFTVPTLSDCDEWAGRVWNACLPLGSEGEKEIKERTAEFLKDFAPEFGFSKPNFTGELTNLDSKTHFEEYSVSVQMVTNNQSVPIEWTFLWNSRGQLLDFNATFVSFEPYGYLDGGPFKVEVISPKDAFDRVNVDDYIPRWENSVQYNPADFDGIRWVAKLCEPEPEPCEPTVNRVERVLGVARDSSGLIWLVPSYAYYSGDIFLFATSGLKDTLSPNLIR